MSIGTEMEKRFGPSIAEKGYELVYAEYIKEGPEWYLRFFIDQEEGIDLDDCVLVSRLIEAVLDEEDLVPTQYILEVSSLGLERPLRNEEDYLKSLGKGVMAYLYKDVDGKKQIRGKLHGYEEQVVLEVEGQLVGIEKSNISKIHLTIED